jgi:hypothetical protein
MNNDARIAALEAKINAAQAELAEIKAGKAPPPPMLPKDVRGVRIVRCSTSAPTGRP